MRSNNLQLIALTLLLAAGAIDAQGAPRAGTADVLLKPPLVEDARQAIIQKLVRSNYPELFSSSAAPGWVAITLLMNQDGTLYKGYKDATQPQPYITNKLKAFDAMGVEYEHHGDRVQLDMRGGSAGGTRIYVRTYFLKPVSDPTRDVALVRAKVNERYRALYKPVSADRLNKVIVMMTESGSIEHARVDSVEATDAVDVAPSPKQFVGLGIPVEQIGPVGKAMLFDGEYEDGLKSKRLMVMYAWPRRANERARTRRGNRSKKAPPRRTMIRR
jgi:hypothetical protein